jgi:hypothetical protein
MAYAEAANNGVKRRRGEWQILGTRFAEVQGWVECTRENNHRRRDISAIGEGGFTSDLSTSVFDIFFSFFASFFTFLASFFAFFDFLSFLAIASSRAARQTRPIRCEMEVHSAGRYRGTV